MDVYRWRDISILGVNMVIWFDSVTWQLQFGKFCMKKWRNTKCWGMNDDDGDDDDGEDDDGEDDDGENYDQ